MSLVGAVFENLLEFLPITIVEQHEIGVYLWCGRYKRSIGPGAYRTCWPLEKIITVDAQPQDLQIRDVNLPLADNAVWVVDAAIAYTIENAYKYMLATREPDELLSSLAKASILSWKGSNALVDDTINVEDQVYGELDEHAEKWGIAVLSFRFTKMAPCRVLVVHGTRGEQPVIEVE